MIVVIFLLFAFVAESFSDGYRIAIIISNDKPAFEQVVSGFKEKFRGQGKHNCSQRSYCKSFKQGNQKRR